MKLAVAFLQLVQVVQMNTLKDDEDNHDRAHAELALVLVGLLVLGLLVLRLSLGAVMVMLVKLLGEGLKFHLGSLADFFEKML